ncbi:hypothetical protein BN946_scf185042.g175 [Trametes cinnabarina]|uniref:Uncharacterized protein n=1 Tax=Pycnoporus cinnabarinus TaxID=5643 RepID=A0A060SA72_PYCCI|nr:hypothetical protein BN946_scf185042.g175 [Trametes cinnabarina]
MSTPFAYFPSLRAIRSSCCVGHLQIQVQASVDALPTFVLPAQEEEILERFWHMQKHAGVLEEALQTENAWLPVEVLKAVVAIIVATRRQTSLIESIRDHSPVPFMFDAKTLDGLTACLYYVETRLASDIRWANSRRGRELLSRAEDFDREISRSRWQFAEATDASGHRRPGFDRLLDVLTDWSERDTILEDKAHEHDSLTALRSFMRSLGLNGTSRCSWASSSTSAFVPKIYVRAPSLAREQENAPSSSSSVSSSSTAVNEDDSSSSSSSTAVNVRNFEPGYARPRTEQGTPPRELSLMPAFAPARAGLASSGRGVFSRVARPRHPTPSPTSSPSSHSTCAPRSSPDESPSPPPLPSRRPGKRPIDDSPPSPSPRKRERFHIPGFAEQQKRPLTVKQTQRRRSSRHEVSRGTNQGRMPRAGVIGLSGRRKAIMGASRASSLKPHMGSGGDSGEMSSCSTATLPDVRLPEQSDDDMDPVKREPVDERPPKMEDVFENVANAQMHEDRPPAHEHNVVMVEADADFDEASSFTTAYDEDWVVYDPETASATEHPVIEHVPSRMQAPPPPTLRSGSKAIGKRRCFDGVMQFVHRLFPLP